MVIFRCHNVRFFGGAPSFLLRGMKRQHPRGMVVSLQISLEANCLWEDFELIRSGSNKLSAGCQTTSNQHAIGFTIFQYLKVQATKTETETILLFSCISTSSQHHRQQIAPYYRLTFESVNKFRVNSCEKKIHLFHIPCFLFLSDFTMPSEMSHICCCFFGGGISATIPEISHPQPGGNKISLIVQPSMQPTAFPMPGDTT